MVRAHDSRRRLPAVQDLDGPGAGNRLPGNRPPGVLDHNDARWDDRADRDLIVRFADGYYGFVKVSMRMDGDFYVAFDGVWNPTGSTWLD